MNSATTPTFPARPQKTPSKPLFAGFLSPAKPRPFSRKELVPLFRGIGSMLRAQINTADALKYYAHGHPDKSMVATLLKIREDIVAGINVHEAFRRSGRFSDTVIGLIQAGSDAGQLHEAFRALAARIASELHFRKQIRKATLMPCVIITVLIGAAIVSQTKIVPQVEEMISGVGQKPEGITSLSFAISHYVRAVWPVFVLSALAIILVIVFSHKIRNLLLGLGMARFRLLRLLILSLRQMTFISTIRLLHSNGINLAKSIRISANSVKNTPFHQELLDAADKYEHSGVPLSTAFAKYTSVDSQVVHMLAIGEKSASLDSQLEMLAEMYEGEANTHMETFTAVINLIVLFIAVLLIAAVLIGTYLPIFLMGPQLMRGRV